MSEGTYMLHKFYTKEEAKKRIDEILTEWEGKGYNTPNDVPPTDKNIVEFLQLMKGLGIPIINYKHRHKLKQVV